MRKKQKRPVKYKTKERVHNVTSLSREFRLAICAFFSRAFSESSEKSRTVANDVITWQNNFGSVKIEIHCGAHE